MRFHQNCPPKDTIEKVKRQPAEWGEHLDVISLVRDLYLESVKDASNLTVETSNDLKAGRGFERTFFQRRCTHGY